KAPRHHNDNFESDKRFIETVAELRFLTLLSCVCLWTHTVAGREHKNERDEEEERSISPNPVEVKIVNDGIMFYFMKPLDNVFIQIVDDSGMLVYEESVPLSTSQSYCISMQGLLFKPYLIRVEGDNIYEEFFILF
ncbi:DUF3244 domain-containing protein, partial [Parabacteroides distasonis]|uniref:DUF3244 domain-containing protein n=1 Tax=Parabacteroides distasonis TaxID=823 RepID=UPI0039B63957